MDDWSERKREFLGEKLLHQETLRKQEIERRREENNNTKAALEQVEYFRKTLFENVAQVYEALRVLKRIEEHNRDDLNGQLNAIGKDVTSLHRYVASSTLFLCAFEVRRAQEEVKRLDSDFRQAVEKLLPKKKFGFKSRPLTVKKQDRDVNDSTPPAMPLISKMLAELFIDRTLGFTNKKGETLTLSHEDIFQKDVTLTSLEDCTILLTGAASTLHITSLKQCTVFSGPVATSIVIDNCNNCTFLVACQQLRIHNTSVCDFYIHVKSRAIIEDTNRVRFAPYNWFYEGIDEHFEAAGLEVDVNHWDCIDDFKWLASDKASPNWRILDEAERVTDWKILQK